MIIINTMIYSDLYNGTTSILTISSNTIDKECINVIKKMKNHGINCNVIINKSIQNDKIENGCQITLCGLNLRYLEDKVWKNLKKDFNLKCANLYIPGIYNGCIINYLSPSKCYK